VSNVVKTADLNDNKKPTDDKEKRIFSEVSLFGLVQTGSGQSGDCGCFNCDGNPCVKISN